MRGRLRVLRSGARARRWTGEPRTRTPQREAAAVVALERAGENERVVVVECVFRKRAPSTVASGSGSEALGLRVCCVRL